MSLGSVLILILGGQAKATTHSVSRICLLFHFGRQFHHSSNCFSTRWKVDQRDSCAASYGGGADLCRRYALFTLVGIACGDDLDAPDLLSPTAPETKTDISTGNKKDRLNGGQGQSVQQGSAGHRAKASSTPLRPKLDTEASLALREQLIIELENISSSENAARWAHRIMGTKNTLTAADAERVEQAFQARLTGITTEVATEPSTQSEQPVDRPGRGKKRRSESVVDKSVLALPSPRRIRDRDHVKSVAKQPCLICGVLLTPITCALPNHRHSGARSAMCSRCRFAGDTIVRCIAVGIDPTVAARLLWLKSHPLLRTANLPESKLVDLQLGAPEDAEDYKAFEAAIITDYDAQSAVEHELVLRLASLLWRRALAAMKLPCGARQVEFCLRSTPWTAASLKKEAVIFVPTTNVNG